jgi:hypothetical protein
MNYDLGGESIEKFGILGLGWGVNTNKTDPLK